MTPLRIQGQRMALSRSLCRVWYAALKLDDKAQACEFVDCGDDVRWKICRRRYIYEELLVR